MTVNEIRTKFIRFFESKEHIAMPSSSLVPKDDTSVLLTTAGMQQFKKWFSGEVTPEHLRTATIQKCVRTNDIDEVGDETHLTFFEMLGNFSFGDYFKKEAIEWGLEFIEKELGVDRSRIWVSIFAGDKEVPRDDESEQIWRSLGITDIREFGREDNFWGPTGSEGPCGPTSEIYVDDVEVWNLVFNEFYMQPDGVLLPLPKTGIDTGAGLERVAATINSLPGVFDTDELAKLREYVRSLMPKQNEKAERVITDHLRTATFLLADGVRPSNLDKGYVLRRLIRRAVRYGKLAGIEQIFCSKVAEKVAEIYGGNYGNLLAEKEKIISELNIEEDKFSRVVNRGLERISFMLSMILGTYEYIESNLISPRLRDGKNIDLKEVVKNPRIYDIPGDSYYDFEVVDQYASRVKDFAVYTKEIGEWLKLTSNINSAIRSGKNNIPSEISKKYLALTEELSKKMTVDSIKLSGQAAFELFSAQGFPFEMTKEIADEWGIGIDQAGFEAEFAKHQEVSRGGMDKKFAGGMENKEDPQIIKYHTAAHLLLAGLRAVLGDNVHQKGSNITAERVRFDFSWGDKMTDEEKKQVEDWVNDKIAQNLDVTMTEMSPEEAKKSGAEGEFTAKYGDKVRVYSIGDVSKEICGGPHVQSTSELGHFRLGKEESSSAGVRRIKATLE